MLVCWLPRGFPAQQVAGLALQHLAQRLERGEPHRLRAPVLEHREVGGSDPDPVGQSPTDILRRASITSTSTTIGIRSPRRARPGGCCASASRATAWASSMPKHAARSERRRRCPRRRPPISRTTPGRDVLTRRQDDASAKASSGGDGDRDEDDVDVSEGRVREDGAAAHHGQQLPDADRGDLHGHDPEDHDGHDAGSAPRPARSSRSGQNSGTITTCTNSEPVSTIAMTMRSARRVRLPHRHSSDRSTTGNYRLSIDRTIALHRHPTVGGDHHTGAHGDSGGAGVASGAGGGGGGGRALGAFAAGVRRGVARRRPRPGRAGAGARPPQRPDARPRPPARHLAGPAQPAGPRHATGHRHPAARDADAVDRPAQAAGARAVG